MIEQALYDILSGDAAIVAAVGNQLYPHVKTGRDGAPFIVYTQITGNPAVNVSGGDVQEASTLQVDVYHQDPAECRDLAALVRSALHKYSGTQAGVAIQYILLQTQRPDYDRDLSLHRMTLEFTAKHN